MRRRSTTAVTGLALASVVLALASCRPGDQEEGDPDVGYAIGPGDTYVALGDSYTAAPRTGAMDLSDGCLRSEVNYPHRIAEETGATLIDSSCAGARTSTLTGPQETHDGGSHPAQLDSLDEETDLVTIRIGANDYNLFARMVLCVILHKGEDGSPCADDDETLGEGSVDERIDDVEDNVVAALEEIEERAPNARVLVIGYPHIVPEEGRCALLPLPAADYDFARRIMTGFNTALRGAADRAGVEYVDMEPVSEGHDICGDEPWIAGIQVTGGNATPWHPYPQESQAVAGLVLKELE